MAEVSALPSSNTPVVTGWTNPTNAYSDTDSQASATAAPGKNTTISSDYAGFGLDSLLPSDLVSIDSVTVESMSAITADGTPFHGLQGYVDGNAVGTETVRSTWSALNTFNLTSWNDGTYGWTRANLLDSSFKVRARCSRTTSNTPFTMSLDYIKVTVVYTPAGSGPTLVQSAFRFRNDNGSESAATWAADENAPLTGNNRMRLRLQVDATNDPAAGALRLEHRRRLTVDPETWSEWEPVPLE